MRVRSSSDTIDAASASIVFNRDSLHGEASMQCKFCHGSLPAAAKKTKRASKWQEDWKKHNMKESKGVLHLYTALNLCGNDFSIASGGVTELAKGTG